VKTFKPNNVLSPAELEIDAQVRTVECPNCGAKPGVRCVSNDLRADGHRQAMLSSHLGRLLAARCGDAE
jgi:predicted RNA-binding Zn-ribbon protein involved in translation (DUF1610 family)